MILLIFGFTISGCEDGNKPALNTALPPPPVTMYPVVPPALGSGYQQGWQNCVATVEVMNNRANSTVEWYEKQRKLYSGTR